MSTHIHSAGSADPGLEALVMLLRFHGVAADREQISHRLGTSRIGVPEMLRCAKDLGLKARACKTQWSRLARTPLPGIATLRDGGFPGARQGRRRQGAGPVAAVPRPTLMTRAEFEAVWDGRLS